MLIFTKRIKRVAYFFNSLQDMKRFLTEECDNNPTSKSSVDNYSALFLREDMTNSGYVSQTMKTVSSYSINTRVLALITVKCYPSIFLFGTITHLCTTNLNVSANVLTSCLDLKLIDLCLIINQLKHIVIHPYFDLRHTLLYIRKVVSKSVYSCVLLAYEQCGG